jgi:Domain of unknown function (DUF5666)
MIVFSRHLLRAALLALAACGGGVETGGTGPTGSSTIEGPITGFGSIVVGGVRFDDRGASVTDADDRAFARDALRLGMVVTVDSDRPVVDASGTRRATATRVRLGGDQLGPVQSIQLAAARVVVLGQTVQLTPATAIEGVSGGLAALAVGDVLEVHGFPALGLLGVDMVATRIERRAAPAAAYRVRGIARDVNLAAAPPTLRVGAQTFDLAGAAVPAGLANGAVVRLSAATAARNGLWPVTAVAVDARLLDDRDEAEIEGLITAFTSPASFAVNGVTVDASGASFPDGVAGLALGARVEVEGRLAAGVLVASRVELRSDDEEREEGVDLRGAISAFNATTRTFVVRGVTVFYGAPLPPRYDGGGESDLANGRCVRVRGELDADRTRAIARRIEFDNDCGN